MTTGGAPAPAGRRRRWWSPRLVLAAGAGLLVVGALAFAGLWQVSASPQFCNSCHIMEPYVEAWRASAHAAVGCVECHYPPGLRDTLWVKYQAVTQVAKWATGAYSSKPFAVVEDASCLRSGCHGVEDLKARGRLVSADGVRFDHGVHLDEAGLGRRVRCASCHSQIVVERHFEVDRRPCFVCHFKGAKGARELAPIAGCTGCHEVPEGDIVIGSLRFNHQDVVRRGVGCQKCHLNVIEGAGEAPRERCLTCHNQPEKLQRYADVALVHASHVADRSIECTRCHSEIRHELPAPIRVGELTDAGPPAATPGRPSR